MSLIPPSLSTRLVCRPCLLPSRLPILLGSYWVSRLDSWNPLLVLIPSRLRADPVTVTRILVPCGSSEVS